MGTGINKIKIKLTIFFVLIVFLLILFLGVGFLSINYFSYKNLDTKNINYFSKIIQKENISPDKLNILLKAEKPILDKKANILKLLERRFNKLPLVDYIFTNNQGEIVKSYIRMHHTDNQFYYDIAQKREKTGIYIENEYIVKNGKFGEGYYIFFKKMHYSPLELSKDIIRFLLLDLLFCIIIYVIGRGVVERIFQPVEENIADMKHFVHNAGHELKTPITVMDSNLQLFSEIQTYDQMMVQEMKQELIHMNSLIDALVKLSDIGNFTSTTKNNLHDIVQEIIKNKSQNIQKKSLKINIDIPFNMYIEANRDYLYIFLSNIIGNAIKYNKNYGSISIIQKKGVLKIIDTGIGIGDIHQEKIFDRFFKVDHSRNSDGFGIGLSLVKKIAQIYHWKLQLISQEQKGTEFMVKFK